MKKIKKIVLFITIFSCLLALSPAIYATGFADHYDAQAAVAYAETHWDDNVGVCDQFVKACLQKGGIEILAGGVDPLKNALLDLELGQLQNLVLSADGVHANISDNPNVRAGDILFFYCTKCASSIHTAIVGGYDAAGNLYCYGHNPGWNKVDWIGSYSHTTDAGEKHQDCSVISVVSMSQSTYSHKHVFTSDLYEQAHPHKMYAECSCGAKYYLGWNATVSYCTECNPATKIPEVSAQVTENSVVLNWTPVENAVEYQVWRATSENGHFTKIYAALGTKMTNRSVEKGKDYYYKVVAVVEKSSDGSVESVESKLVHCTIPDDTQISAPVLTGEINSSNKAVVTWNSVSGAETYEVWRSTSSNGTYTKLLTTKNLKCTNSAKAGTYYYKVRAVNANGECGNFSNVVSVTVPVTATGTLNSSNKAVVTWNAALDAEKYEVWRSTSLNGTYTKLLTTKNLKCTNSAKAGTYYYKVRAVNADGTYGSFSNVVSVTVPVTIPSVPTLTGTLNSSNKAVVTWNSVSGAETYEVWRSTSSNGTYTKLLTTKNLKCTNSAKAGTYYYKVRAVNANGECGNFSNVVSVTVPVTATGTLNSSNKAVVTWNAALDAEKYEVWRSTSLNGTYTKLLTTKNLKCTNSAKAGTYYYKVRAVNADGTYGSFSNVVSVTVPVTATGTLNSSNKAVVTWNAALDAEKYEVWRSTSLNGTYTKLLTTKNLKCTNSAKAGTYYYKVRAVNANGESGNFSNVVCVTVPTH